MVMQLDRVIEREDIRNTPQPAVALSLAAQNSVDIDRVGAVLRIEGELVINYDADASVAETQDSLAQLFSNMQIRDGAGNVYWTAQDGRVLQYMSNFHAGDPSFWPSLPLGVVNAAGQVARVRFIIDFQDTPVPGRPREINPIAAVLTRVPGFALNSLKLEFTLGTAASLGSAGVYTVNSLTMTLTPIIVLGDSQSWFRLIANEVAKPQYRSGSQALTVASSFGLDLTSLPTGFLLSKSLFVVLDDSSPAVRDNATVTALQYLNNLRSWVRWQQDWLNYIAQLQNTYFSGGITYPAGVALINWEEVVGGQGLDRVDRQENDDKIQLSVANAGTILFLHKGFALYPEQMFAQFR